MNNWNLPPGVSTNDEHINPLNDAMHINCSTCGHHTVTNNDALKIACGNCWSDIQGEPRNQDTVTCGNCGRSWCEKCDPAPGALCHWCHGRGYSDAEVKK